MFNYILNVDEQKMVLYIMRMDGYAVAASMRYDKALTILGNGTPHASDMYGGFPITSDDIYFFDGEYEDDDSDREITLGADGIPIPAKGVSKPRKKRNKDVTSE